MGDLPVDLVFPLDLGLLDFQSNPANYRRYSYILAMRFYNCTLISHFYLEIFSTIGQQNTEYVFHYKHIANHFTMQGMIKKVRIWSNVLKVKLVLE